MRFRATRQRPRASSGSSAKRCTESWSTSRNSWRLSLWHAVSIRLEPCRLDSERAWLSRSAARLRGFGLPSAGMAHAALPRVMSERPERELPRPARIVVAEDDLEMRRLVADCLRKEGYEV